MAIGNLLNKSDLEKEYGIKKTELSLFMAFGLPCKKFESVRIFEKDAVDQFMLDNPQVCEYLQARKGAKKRGGRPAKQAEPEILSEVVSEVTVAKKRGSKVETQAA